MKADKKLTPLEIATWMLKLTTAVNNCVKVDTITLICPYCRTIWMVAYDDYFDRFVNHVSTCLIEQSREREL